MTSTFGQNGAPLKRKREDGNYEVFGVNMGQTTLGDSNEMFYTGAIITPTIKAFIDEAIDQFKEEEDDGAEGFSLPDEQDEVAQQTEHAE